MTRRYIRPVLLPTIQSVEISKPIQYDSYEDYLASPRWSELREQALERDGGRCRLCNSSKFLNIHHRGYPKNWGQEIVNDLTTLCQSCHEIFSIRKPTFKMRKGKKQSKQRKLRHPGGYNSRANSILFRQGVISTRDGYSIMKTAKAICDLRGIPVPETKDKKLLIIKEFCDTTH